MATEITIKPKEQQVLRDYAHLILGARDEMGFEIRKGEFTEAYNGSLEARIAMEGLDAIGWGGERPH